MLGHLQRADASQKIGRGLAHLADTRSGQTHHVRAVFFNCLKFKYE
jgi:hypothetical protein